MFVICRASVVRIFYSIYEPTWRLLFGLPDLLDAAPKKIVKFYTCFSDSWPGPGFLGSASGRSWYGQKDQNGPQEPAQMDLLGALKIPKFPQRKKKRHLLHVFFWLHGTSVQR